MSFINKKRNKLKEAAINSSDLSFEEGLDNRQALTEEQIDKIIETLVDTGDPSTFTEPFNRDIMPLGKNRDRSKKLFYRRKYYKDYAFPKPAPSQNIMDDNVVDDNSKFKGASRKTFTPFYYTDLMYDKTFYGRIDTLNRTVYPSEKFLKLVSNTQDVFLLNFVCDAANDMLRKIDRLKDSGKLDTKSIYYGFEVKKGWKSFVQDHHRTMKALYESFAVNYINSPALFTRITSFDTFSSEFLSFLDRFLPKFPITRTNMEIRRGTSPLVSGIMFEISNSKHDDDKEKYENYILDRHFLQIQNIANAFGFMVDKNAPWRFIADLESPQMKKRMADLGFDTLQMMFDSYYYRAHLYEADSLKTYFLSFYDSYIQTYPYYTVVEKCKEGSKAKLLYRQQRAQDPFTDKKLLEFYYFIRAKEAGKDWNQESFDIEVVAAYEIFEKFGFVEALNYINDKTSLIVGRGGNFGNRTKMSEKERIIYNHEPSYKRNNFKITL